uniref:Uncharacterized protein n=1 Tax=Leptocylindrus danicus TaxID=163516 RepID=A0A7S2NW59_9STRA
MGKKAKTAAGKAKAANRKVLPDNFPKPVPSVEEQVGSGKPVEQPGLPGENWKLLGGEGYDDGGVADLTLLLDLEDVVLRRKRGDKAYYEAMKNDLLPRQQFGAMAKVGRRDQKVQLAQVLFADEKEHSKVPSEVYVEPIEGDEDPAVIKEQTKALVTAKEALKLSMILSESACVSLSLAEICKRIMVLRGKEGGEDALRVACKACELAGTGFWDSDEVMMEAMETPKLPDNHQTNATKLSLANPASLKLIPIRVSELCYRTGYMQKGNALASLGREAEAREAYELIFPLLTDEVRSARIDWERFSVLINVGNTYAREKDYTLADEQYKLAERIGQDHVDAAQGSEEDGKNMISVVKRARAIALKKVGRDDEAKALMKELVEQQVKEQAEAAKKAEEAAAKRKAELEEQKKAREEAEKEKQ